MVNSPGRVPYPRLFLLVIGLFRFSISSWGSFYNLHVYRNLSISSRLFNLLIYNCLWYALIIFYKIYSNIFTSISDFSNLNLLFFFLVKLKFCQFCWSFQRINFWFQWFSLLLFYSPFHLFSSYLHYFLFSASFVTEQDPMGPSWDRCLPHILCFSSSLKYLGNSIWCIFPEFFRC